MKDLSERTTALFADCTRDKLLKNSLQLFNRKGFTSVTTALLASSAKVREGTLWYHFKSKKSLVESHIDLFKTNFGLRLNAERKIDLEILVKQLFSQYYFDWDFRYLLRDDLANKFSRDKPISKKLDNLTHLILPGVGSFKYAMQNLVNDSINRKLENVYFKGRSGKLK